MRLGRLISVAVLASALGGSAYAQDKPEIAFVVNGPSDFWKIMEAAVAKAQTELPDVTLSFRYPERADAAVQRRMMDDLVAAGVAALAVSVVDPPTSTDAINSVASQIPFFTFDSDATQSDRIAYIGSSNTELGTAAGELMKKAMAGKQGKCIGFVGLPGADNAKERIQGYNQAVAGTGLELIDVRGDDIDQTRARANVDDVLVANPDVNCMVGFYSYNPPRMYEALRDAGKLGEITVVAFDEDPITLGAVKEGSFAGTVVQQPYEWGYQGSKLIAAFLKGDKSGIPADGIIIIPGLTLTQENVEAFQADFQAKLAGK
ncbi:MAG: ABC transporter substrate-binding protein [Alphaproteobacteria bacterium]|nr:MAG: ABC transporter substrate-binding protein [Alphaproteobacteria bacterium]